MSEILLIAVCLVALMTLGVVFFGAPFIPTRSADVKKIFNMLSLPNGALIVDLGSGDGRVIQAAASRGYRALGYELNIVLQFIAWLRTRKYRTRVQLKTGNYWRHELPDDTAVVFVFLAGPFMERLRTYLEAHVARTQKELTLVSYGFRLPGYMPYREDKAVLLYRLSPLQQHD